MWILVLIVLLLVVTPSFAEQSFSKQYERDYNLFNPAIQYAPVNPFNPANRYNPNTPVAPLNCSRWFRVLNTLNTWKRYRESDSLPCGH